MVSDLQNRFLGGRFSLPNCAHQPISPVACYKRKHDIIPALLPRLIPSANGRPLLPWLAFPRVGMCACHLPGGPPPFWWNCVVMARETLDY